MKRKIVADSSCDMWELNGVDFAVAPITISTDNKHYVDNQDLDVHLMSEDLASYKGTSHTACPSVGSWLDCYEGFDEVFVVTLTGSMSGTYNSAMTAKGIYEEENENVKVHVFDSLSTGPEMRLLIEKLKEMIEEEFGWNAYIPFYADRAIMTKNTCEIKAANIPQVSVEKDMEDFFVDVDADYRQLRRRIINLVVKNPELMPAAMNTIQKGWRYVKRLFKDFGIS